MTGSDAVRAAGLVDSPVSVPVGLGRVPAKVPGLLCWPVMLPVRPGVVAVRVAGLVEVPVSVLAVRGRLADRAPGFV